MEINFVKKKKKTKWKSLTGELYYISCPQSRKVLLESTAIPPILEVEKVARKIYEIFFPRSGKPLTEKLTQISFSATLKVGNSLKSLRQPR